MAEKIQINDNTWIFDEGGVRFFLLVGTEKALLIDTGMTSPDARQQAEALTDKPVELLNTHTHRDHISGNGAFEECYMAPAEEPVYREAGGTGRIVPVKDGDVIDLGDRPLEIYETPGHSPGSIAILDVKGRVLITGDPIQDGTIFMFGDMDAMKQYVESLGKVKALAGRADEIWPSHGSLPVKFELIDKLAEGAGQIIEGSVTGNKVDMHGMKAVAIRFPYATFLRPDTGK